MFPYKGFSIVAVGPPCGTRGTKVGDRGRGRGVTHRRALYGLHSVAGTTSGLLGFNNGLYVYVQPRHLFRAVRTVGRCGVRPGTLHLITTSPRGTP